MKPKLNKALFWDIDFDSIDYEANSRYVIDKVISRGDVEDFGEILKYYGKERIKNEIVKIRYLDKLTLNFCSVYFDIKKEDFRCYNTEPSIRELWNY